MVFPRYETARRRSRTWMPVAIRQAHARGKTPSGETNAVHIIRSLSVKASNAPSPGIPSVPRAFRINPRSYEVSRTFRASERLEVRKSSSVAFVERCEFPSRPDNREFDGRAALHRRSRRSADREIAAIFRRASKNSRHRPTLRGYPSIHYVRYRMSLMSDLARGKSLTERGGGAITRENELRSKLISSRFTSRVTPDFNMTIA